jgi:protein OS-9
MPPARTLPPRGPLPASRHAWRACRRQGLCRRAPAAPPCAQRACPAPRPRPQEDASASGHAFKYLGHTFAGGATCHLTGAPRSAEVRFACGAPSGRENVITAVKEFPACNYVLTVASPFLCKHPAFRPQPERVRAIACTALEPPPAAGRGEEEAEAGQGAGGDAAAVADGGDAAAVEADEEGQREGQREGHGGQEDQGQGRHEEELQEEQELAQQREGGGGGGGGGGDDDVEDEAIRDEL